MMTPNAAKFILGKKSNKVTKYFKTQKKLFYSLPKSLNIYIKLFEQCKKNNK